MGNFIKRPPPGQSGGGGDRAFEDRAFVQSRPATAEFLAMTRWDDGKARTTGTLFLFVEEGLWKVCLNDRDGGRVAFLTGETIEGLLDSVEAGLVSGDLDWRRSAGKRGGGR